MVLVKDLASIREDYKVSDGLIEFETYRLEGDLNNIKESSVVALFGPYGSGKSTTLYNLQMQDTDKTHSWFQFDAWRYPERKGLWDGLIIEIAKQAGKHKGVQKKIDGNPSVLGKWGGIVGELFSQFGSLLPDVETNKISVDSGNTSKAAKVGDKALEIFGRSPAKRTYEMERILADVLVSVEGKRIYIVAEDLDRSGSDGVNFLETLNYFLKNNEQLLRSGKTVIVIAPMSNKVQQDSEKRESLYKCVDLFLEFKPTIKSSKEFLKSVFTDEALGLNPDKELDFIDNIEAFINHLLETVRYGINIRKLKLIIRQTNQKFTELKASSKNVDWRAVLVVESMKFAEDTPHDRSMLDEAIGAGEIRGLTAFAGLLNTIHKPQHSIYIYQYSNTTKKEEKQLNRQTLSYRFVDYNSQANTSVWEGWTESHNSTRGYIASYYIK